MKPRVVIESPYAGNIAENVVYAKKCLAHSVRRGEAPIASHLLFLGTLDDNNPEERKMGMEAGHAWIACADIVAVYADLGISPGMQKGIEIAKAMGRSIDIRYIVKANPQ